MDKTKTYTLLDSGQGKKLEQFGPYILERPAPQALWQPRIQEWHPHAVFTREGQNHWKGNLQDNWTIEVAKILFKISPTDFGHLGIFPEQKFFWECIMDYIHHAKRKLNVLNLFAYSGGSTLAAALAGASVCHLDASKGMVAWARENAALNGLDKAPIRWIVDDVMKFLRREIKRSHFYDAIILDPPSFGRGAQGEVFKIEESLPEILSLCKMLLSDKPEFILLSCHTPNLTPIALSHLLKQMMGDKFGGNVDSGEMLLLGKEPVLSIPSGAFARWTH